MICSGRRSFGTAGFPSSSAAWPRTSAGSQEVQAKARYLKEEVDADDVAEIVSKWTGIPVSKMLESERERLVRLEAELGQRVVGQRLALTAVSNAVRRARAGLQDPNRPTGSFIFLGPTGVGKTETARALAEFLFDDERAMVRLDMSEYMEKHSVARMIGAPPGYVGYEEGGQLTEAVRRRPYSVILFDEIEKAHPDVFNVLLQILDDGRLTDSQGRLVDFRNTVIIMTSNIGSSYIVEAGAQASDAAWERVEQRVRDELRNHFRPEFLNRVDDVIVFRPLSRDDLLQIVDLQLRGLERALAARHLKLEVTPEARAWLAAQGYDPVYGARPLKRVIQRELQNVIALELLEGRFHEGDTIRVEQEGGHLRLVRMGRGRLPASRNSPVRRGTPSPSDLAGMQAALRLARAASVREEVPVGAVIVADGEILAEAHNETEMRRDPTAHAELLAIQRALQKVGDDRLTGPRSTSRWSRARNAPGRSCCRRSAGSSSAPTTRAAAWRVGLRPAPPSPTQSPAGGRRRVDGRGLWRAPAPVLSEQAYIIVVRDRCVSGCRHLVDHTFRRPPSLLRSA